ncbi:hemolysin family protein [Candidatus Latescibacterota bacterium]
MALLFAYLFLALSFSFLCSLLESILLSVRQPYIALLINRGKRAGRILQDMKTNVSLPLATILTVNTIANVVGAAGVGAQTYKLFGSEFVAVASGILTVLILVLSEIIPKTLGTVYWKTLAVPATYVLRGLIFVTYPVVIILEGISRFITTRGHHSRISREEIMALAEIGEKEGILHEKEARIIKNLFLLTDIRTGDISTPRAVVFAFQKDLTVRDVIEKHSPLPFSRIPVFGTDLDDIIGIVIRRQLFDAYRAGRGIEPVGHFIVPVFAVPESKPVTDLLDEFISRREHLFLVIDEFGGTEGIVTLEDAVETLLGVEIMDEFDSVEDMRSYAREKWKPLHGWRET